MCFTSEFRLVCLRRVRAPVPFFKTALIPSRSMPAAAPEQAAEDDEPEQDEEEGEERKEPESESPRPPHHRVDRHCTRYGGYRRACLCNPLRDPEVVRIHA